MPTQDIELKTDSPQVQASSALQPSKPTRVQAPAVVKQAKINPEENISALIKEEQEVLEEVKSSGVIIDLGLVFAGSPTIYSILFVLSIASVGIWSYALLSLRNADLFPSQQLQTLEEQIKQGSYDAALQTCQSKPSILFGMMEAAIKNRKSGSSTMLEMMKTEGKRISTAYWQKIGLLNDIAIIAPMLGLLGTVLGMFYAFYDLNRSAESISALFDGLGISVGTTVGGLVVAILALLFNAMTKYRLMRQLTRIESRAHALAQSIATSQDTP